MVFPFPPSTTCRGPNRFNTNLLGERGLSFRLRRLASVLASGIRLGVSSHAFFSLTRINIIVHVQGSHCLGAVLLQVASDRTRAVSASKAFLSDCVSLLHRLLIRQVFRHVVPTSVYVFRAYAGNDLISVPLRSVSIRASIRRRATFRVRR